MLAGKDPAILAQFGASAQVRDKKSQQLISSSLMFLLALHCLCMVCPPPFFLLHPLSNTTALGPSLHPLHHPAAEFTPCSFAGSTHTHVHVPQSPPLQSAYALPSCHNAALCWQEYCCCASRRQCQRPKTCDCKHSVLHAVLALHVARVCAVLTASLWDDHADDPGRDRANECISKAAGCDS